jgi:hypothetical protein
LAAGLRVVLHLTRDREGTRRLRQIGVLTPRADSVVEPAEAVAFSGAAMVEGPAWSRLNDLMP